jgi:ribosomal protein S18 acetylase RimI-like enzyme
MYGYMVYRHKSASLRLHNWGNGRAAISHLRSKKRNKGHATKLLKVLMNLLDEQGLTVILEARADKVKGGLTQKQLVRFYQKFSFVAVWGEPLLMERVPKSNQNGS